MPTTLDTQLRPPLPDSFIDSRTQGYQGPSRYARLRRVAPSGGASIAKSEDGTRCAVAGKESLRIVRVVNPSSNPDNKEASVKIDGSRNFWDNSGLKIDSASTDVAWGHGSFNNKILTSARNGEIILWDIHKSGNIKYERRTKDHIRSINKLSVSPVVHYYCITGSADGDMRIWDLRDLSKSLMRIKHPTSVRSIVFSPSVWQPLQAVVGLDNGSLYRWDLKMGQRGQLDRLAVAHSAPITTLDWRGSTSNTAGAGGSGPQDNSSNGLGWLVSGGLDRCVKVWDLTAPHANAHISNKPTYTLHPSFPVRRVSWRPGYECELAVASNEELSAPPIESQASASSGLSSGLLSRVGSGLGLDAMFLKNLGTDIQHLSNIPMSRDDRLQPYTTPPGDTIEIWDVRREWIAKWSVNGSSLEGSISDIAFGDSDALWAQHSSGTFSQFDLRETSKPIDAINRVVTTWDPTGCVTFVTENKVVAEPPYDDLPQAEPRPGQEFRKPPHKTLGDPPIRLANQMFGMFVPEDTADDLEVFTILARDYVLQGSNKQSICHTNAQVAYLTGRERATQVWTLMENAFTDFIPTLSQTPGPSPRPKSHRHLPYSGSGLPTPVTNYTFPPLPGGNDSIHRRSPGHKTRSSTKSGSRSRSVSATRGLTPTSSNNSSPLHLANGLPPLTPNRPFAGRRESVDELARRSSSYRRMSLSQNAAASSPGEKSLTSLKHVGEGALDDSSSSDDEPNPKNHTEDDFFSDNFRSMASPLANLSRTVVVPSPLSRVIGQRQWSAEEDNVERDSYMHSHYGPQHDDGDDDNDNDDDSSSSSPSPRSTDTESDDSSASRREAKSRARRFSHRTKSRSRSSTVASLAAPRLTHQASHSSIRTVTAAEVTPKEIEEPKQLNRDEGPTLAEALAHKRQKSLPFSEYHVDGDPRHNEEDLQIHTHHPPVPISKRRIEIIRADEKRFKEMAWEVIREALEEFAEEGDVQMCATMVLIAREELKVPVTRACRFVEAYLGTVSVSPPYLHDAYTSPLPDRLAQSRLHTCAAYIRRVSNLESIRNRSLEETVVYTICGKCHKPLLKAAFASSSSSGRYTSGAFSYCLGCKTDTVKCSICRLPVRSLLFQCSICKHGGHQSCYRKFYLQHAMVELPDTHPAAFFPASESSERGRTLSRQQERLSEDDQGSISSTRRSVADVSTSRGGITDGSSNKGGGASLSMLPMDTSSTRGSIIGSSSIMGDTNSEIADSPAGTDQSVTRLMGHPCAAGCGHFCWAANSVLDVSDA
ncbi:hypothetical protein CC1G_08668 [Coprinopsis cinerea okayama7|uniref:WDR59/RTC1-like RING zinc finger domain-containing protein n=1 Tax=Coprinopsis cinerea (strain Okayama-7 / 130 / ATCC MYA-4618 / FGSC 9003) TaxID=240176 RepID=A8NZD7_COPC7|nr:hypothetical protein CC1G_08668 [Coprinopsis cinerea okayama7\|eukprot:XP_001837655.2 hypothetical protein CC1G_08668 [Coprinopsis cinerea okayama7\